MHHIHTHLTRCPLGDVAVISNIYWIKNRLWYFEYQNEHHPEIYALRPEQDVWYFAGSISKCIIGQWKKSVFVEISLKFVSNGPIHARSSFNQIMASCHQATCVYSYKCSPTSMTWYGITRPQWVFLVYWHIYVLENLIIIIPPPNEVGGGYTGFTLSVCPSVRLVCRRHGFRSISEVCFGISISNFLCMLMVAIGRSLLIFSDVAFKMAAWRPYWIFWFPDSNFTLALNINFKLQQHNTYVYW